MVDKAVKIGWIGTGVMGKSMAGYLLKSGLSMNVFNRTATKAQDLLAAGAHFASAIDVAKESDFLFLMLGYPHDVEKMVLSHESGLL